MRQHTIRRLTRPLLLALTGSLRPAAAQPPDDISSDDLAACQASGWADRSNSATGDWFRGQAACIRAIVRGEGSGRGGGLPLPDLVTETACRPDAGSLGVVACTVTMTNQGPAAATFPAGAVVIHATASVSTGAVTVVHIGWDAVARSDYAIAEYACPASTECTAGIITNATHTLLPGEVWSFPTVFRARVLRATVTTLATANPVAAIPELYEDDNSTFATSATPPPQRAGQRIPVRAPTGPTTTVRPRRTYPIRSARRRSGRTTIVPTGAARTVPSPIPPRDRLPISYRFLIVLHSYYASVLCTVSELPPCRFCRLITPRAPATRSWCHAIASSDLSIPSSPPSCCSSPWA
jgi:hypothetical protein